MIGRLQNKLVGSPFQPESAMASIQLRLVSVHLAIVGTDGRSSSRFQSQSVIHVLDPRDILYSNKADI